MCVCESFVGLQCRPGSRHYYSPLSSRYGDLLQFGALRVRDQAGDAEAASRFGISGVGKQHGGPRLAYVKLRLVLV